MKWLEINDFDVKILFGIRVGVFLDGSTRTVSRGLMARCGSRAYGSLLLLLVASCSWFHDLLALDSWFVSMESRP